MIYFTFGFSYFEFMLFITSLSLVFSVQLQSDPFSSSFSQLSTLGFYRSLKYWFLRFKIISYHIHCQFWVQLTVCYQVQWISYFYNSRLLSILTLSICNQRNQRINCKLEMDSSRIDSNTKNIGSVSSRLQKVNGLSAQL